MGTLVRNRWGIAVVLTTFAIQVAVGSSSVAVSQTNGGAVEPVSCVGVMSCQPFEVERLADVVIREWAALTVPADGNLSLWKREWKAAATGARVIVGASSEALFASVVDGGLTVDGQEVSAGECIVFPLAGRANGRVKPFSIGHLRRSLDRRGFTAWNDSIATAEASQRSKLFWGLLRPSGVNIGMPSGEGLQGEVLELARRSATLNPAVVSIRQEALTPSDYAERTARAFVQALADRDTATIAGLLSPRPFASLAGTPFFDAARNGFAEELMKQNWAIGINPVSFRQGTDELTWRVDGGRQTMRIELIVVDRSVFVSSVSPEVVEGSTPNEALSPHQPSSDGHLNSGKETP